MTKLNRFDRIENRISKMKDKSKTSRRTHEWKILERLKERLEMKRFLNHMCSEISQKID